MAFTGKFEYIYIQESKVHKRVKSKEFKKQIKQKAITAYLNICLNYNRNNNNSEVLM